jgi:hypothetical protein
LTTGPCSCAAVFASGGFAGVDGGFDSGVEADAAAAFESPAPDLPQAENINPQITSTTIETLLIVALSLKAKNSRM